MGEHWREIIQNVPKKMILNMKFTIEELSTILCLNYRPLSPASDDPNYPDPLTSGHFILEVNYFPQPNFIVDINGRFRETTYN